MNTQPDSRENKQNLSIKKKKLKVSFSIKKKLLGTLIPIVIIAIASILLLIYTETSQIILKKSEENLETTTDMVVNDVKAWMKETITALNVERDTIEYFGMDHNAEMEYIKHTVNRYDAFPAGIYLADTSGELYHASFVPGPDYDLFQKSWYQDGLKSEDFIFGSVYFDEDSQAYVVGASGMLKDKTGQVRGVAAADIYLDAISDIIKQVRLEQTGGMFLVDTRTNMIIGHKDESLVGTSLDEQENALYGYVSGLISKGTLGLQDYKEESGEFYLDLSQVPDSHWIAVSYVPHGEIMEELNTITRTMMIIGLVGVLVLLVLSERFIQLIVKPVKKLTNVLTTITDGDFTVNVEVHTRDEIGLMANGLQHFITTMRDIIRQISEISSKLNTQSENSSRIADSLSTDSGVQSKAMEELNMTVGDLARSISEVADNATNLSLLVGDADASGSQAREQMEKTIAASDQGRGDMRAVVTSMKDISDKMNHLEASVSQVGSSITEINSIVELIRDIADETNLLSLNASIEAARAGESGRGFAVVADQIGKLAATSADAVDNIAKLTGQISSLVENTVKEASSSAETIKSSAEAVDTAGENFETIFDTIQATNTTVSTMIDKVAQVNDVAVTVAGITEEQSAASEEILATSENLSESSRNVLSSSRSVASDSEALAENARKLAEYMKMFQA